MSWESYLGPFLEVRKKRETETVDLCNNHHFGSGNFCSECGRKYSKRLYEKDLRPEYSDIMSETLVPCSDSDGSVLDTEDEFVDGLMSNEYGHEYSAFDIHECGHSYIDAEEIAKAKLWFSNRYKKEITELRNEFGSDNVSVKYGFLSWYS